MKVGASAKARLCLFLSLLIAVAPVVAAPRVDFNGDGRGDVLVRNVFSGELSAWLTDGTRVLQTASYSAVDPLTGWTPIGTKDTNADGRSDLLWYNVTTGDVAVWLINGATVGQTGVYGRVPRESGWAPVAIEEFNADGRADLLWYNTLTGEVAVWLLDGVRLRQGVFVGAVPPQEGWTPISARDFNGDGHTDLLWRHQQTGHIAVWLLVNGQLAGSGVIEGPAPQTGFIPATTRDFNGDGRADLFWYNPFTGGLQVWLMAGTSVLRAVSLGSVDPRSGWGVIAAEDFNGDGHADLLWGNAISGDLAVWILSSGQLAASGIIGRIPPSSGFTIAGLDDYNGDGRTDLFLFNAFSGATTTWLMNGTTVSASPSFASVSRSSVWQPQIPR